MTQFLEIFEREILDLCYHLKAETGNQVITGITVDRDFYRKLGIVF